MIEPAATPAPRRRPLLLYVAAIWFPFALFVTSEPGTSFELGLLFGLSFVALGLWLLVATIIFLSHVVRGKGHANWRRMAFAYSVVLSLLLLILWLNSSHAAVYARIKLSEAALLDFVREQQLRGGSTIGDRAGLFDVDQTEVRGSTVWLVTNDCFLVTCGLVYSPDGAPPVINFSSEDSYSHLGGPWWLWTHSF